MTDRVREELKSIPLTAADAALLIEALDAYEYWQLGEVLPRNNGVVWIPGDSVDLRDRYWEDENPTFEQAVAIGAVRECRLLADELRSATTQD